MKTIGIILFHVQANRNYLEATSLFSDFSADRPVSPRYVRSVVKKITTNISEKDSPRSGLPSAKTAELQIHVSGIIVVQPMQSVSTVAPAVGTEKSTVHRIF